MAPEHFLHICVLVIEADVFNRCRFRFCIQWNEGFQPILFALALLHSCVAPFPKGRDCSCFMFTWFARPFSAHIIQFDECIQKSLVQYESRVRLLWFGSQDHVESLNFDVVSWFIGFNCEKHSPSDSCTSFNGFPAEQPILSSSARAVHDLTLLQRNRSVSFGFRRCGKSVTWDFCAEITEPIYFLDGGWRQDPFASSGHFFETGGVFKRLEKWSGRVTLKVVTMPSPTGTCINRHRDDTTIGWDGRRGCRATGQKWSQRWAGSIKTSILPCFMICSSLAMKFSSTP